MNLSAALSPAPDRPGPLPFAAAEAAKHAVGRSINSFSAELDHAFKPERGQAFAKSRSSRGRAAGDSNSEDPHNELKPIEEERRQGREESQASLAGACAVAPAPAHSAERDFSHGRQLLCSAPATTDNPLDTLTVAGATTEPALVAPPTAEPTSADGKAGANVPGELVTIANAKLEVIETPDANSSVASNKEPASDGQPKAKESLSAGNRDLIELGLSKTDAASPFPTDRSQALQDSSTNTAEGPAALQKELVDGSTNPRGIVGAKPEEQMKATTKQDEIAACANQIMPGAQTVQLRPARLDTGREARRIPVEPASAEALVGVASGKVPLPTADTDPRAGDELKGRLSLVDQMSKVIAREVQVFKRTADESMEVVLTPDQNTQISLRLQWREGKVEILAHCHQGDYPALNTQWSQLQTALGHQGVRLAQLTQPAHTGYTEFFSSAGFTQSHNGGRQQPEPKVALDELPSAAAIKPLGKPQPSAVVRTRHLLESWA